MRTSVAMKFDTEYPHHHMYANENTTKVVHNDNHFILPSENHFMVDMLEIGNDNLKEENLGVKYPNANESCKVTLPPRLHGITKTKMEGHKNRSTDAYDCTEAPYSDPNSGVGLVVKEDYYVNRAFAELERAKIVVSMNGGSCNGVENLSFSEEMHSCESSLADEEEVGQKVLLSSDTYSNNDNGDVAKEMEDTTGPHELEYEVVGGNSIATMDRNPSDPTSVNTSEENCSCASSIGDGDMLDTAECGVTNFFEDRDKHDTSDSITSNILDEVAKESKGSLQEDLSILSCSDDPNHSIDRAKIKQATLEESKTKSIALSSAMEDSVPREGGKEILSTCKVPSSVITFTFDPQEASISSREANGDDKDIEQSKQACIGPGTEGATFDGSTTSSRTSFLHLMQGESNIRGPDFPFDPVVNSGHIPYSGSISIRSDSSTTSARSFAFPVLQSEWNSSPVKMAKARPRGRKLRLFCCRF